MRYTIKFLPAALKSYQKIKDSEVEERTKKALSAIAMQPYAVGKQLKGEYRDLHSYRFGAYRIIYRILQSTSEIIVYRISHRKEVYRRLMP